MSCYSVYVTLLYDMHIVIFNSIIVGNKISYQHLVCVTQFFNKFWEKKMHMYGNTCLLLLSDVKKCLLNFLYVEIFSVCLLIRNNSLSSFYLFIFAVVLSEFYFELNIKFKYIDKRKMLIYFQKMISFFRYQKFK